MRPYSNTLFPALPTQDPGYQSVLAANLTSNMSGQQANPYGQGRGPAEGTFNLSGLGEALPRGLPHDDSERSASESSATLHQQSPSPFAGQHPMANAGYGMYAPQYAIPYQQAAANPGVYPPSHLSQPSQQGGSGPVQPSYPAHNFYANQPQQPYLLYPGQYGQATQAQHTFPGPYGQPFARGPNQAFGAGIGHGNMPEGAGIPGRAPQYGAFAPSGPLGYGYGSSLGFTRSDMVPGKLAFRSRHLHPS